MPAKPMILKFKITLMHTKPPIWRRIEVPNNFNFSEFHNAIQCAMGWYDCHLHEFHDPHADITIGDVSLDNMDIFEERKIQDERKCLLSKFFKTKGMTMNYLYDFGDSWEHKILLEDVLPLQESIKYPRCTGGKLTCPPEDCGGTWGYYEMLNALAHPETPEGESILEWLGRYFDPNAFVPEDVHFFDMRLR